MASFCLDELHSGCVNKLKLAGGSAFCMVEVYCGFFSVTGAMPVPHAAGLAPPPVVSGSLQPSQGHVCKSVAHYAMQGVASLQSVDLYDLIAGLRC